jgi:hypothetical protein
VPVLFAEGRLPEGQRELFVVVVAPEGETAMQKDKNMKPTRLDSAPLEYAPENEHGVVFLFAALAKRWGLRVESVQSGFPDCIAYQRTGQGDTRKRIEFEFRSSNFKVHGHNAKKCDWIVCWEHDWHNVPARLKVIELRKEFGLGFNVWIQPVAEEYKDGLPRTGRTSWSVPGRASKNDLVLFYRSGRNEMCIKDVFQMVGEVRPDRRWKYRGTIRRVCGLASPLDLAAMKRDRVLQTAGFIRGNVRGRQGVTEFWPYLYSLIVRRNPSARKLLAKFDPARF